MLKIITLTTLFISLSSIASQSTTPEFSVLTEELCVSEECHKSYQQLKRFAKYGSKEAQIVVATAYLTGNGLEKNPKLAVRNLKKAKAAGSARAAWTLSYLYNNGIGVEQNTEQARELLQYAIDKNFGPALFQKAMEYLDLNKQDNIKSIALLKRAINASDKSAKYLLAQMYEYGEGIEQDLIMAAKLYQELQFSSYKDSQDRLQEVIEKAKKDASSSFPFSELDPNIEVLTISGVTWDIQKTLSTLVENLEVTGLYDGRGIGKIRGKGCVNSSSPCESIKGKEGIQDFFRVFR